MFRTTVVIECRVERVQGTMHFVSTRFFGDDQLAVFALTTLREVA